MVAEIDDRAMYPGSYVRQLVRQAREHADPLRWIELKDAAIILRRRPDTLRKQCARWSGCADPTVRVRKKTDAEGSHWLLCEADVYALVRTRGPVPGLDEEGDSPDCVDEDAVVAHWVDIATKHI